MLELIKLLKLKTYPSCGSSVCEGSYIFITRIQQYVLISLTWNEKQYYTDKITPCQHKVVILTIVQEQSFKLIKKTQTAKK